MLAGSDQTAGHDYIYNANISRPGSRLAGQPNPDQPGQRQYQLLLGRIFRSQRELVRCLPRLRVDRERTGATPYTDSGLNPNSTHTYFIVAKSSSGDTTITPGN